MKQIHHTNLETTSDVKDTLEWKIQAIEKDNLPIDTGLADYIALSIDNLDNQLAQIKFVKSELADREKDIKAQIEAIKVDGATFLLENGLEKLGGIFCSSVSVTKEKQSEVVTTEERQLKYNIPQNEIDELLVGLGKAEYETVVVEKKTNFIPAKIRVNKRKILIGTVEDETTL